MVQMNLLAGQEYKHRYKRMDTWTWVREGGWDEWEIMIDIYTLPDIK